jgi:hypothetical protein
MHNTNLEELFLSHTLSPSKVGRLIDNLTARMHEGMGTQGVMLVVGNPLIRLHLTVNTGEDRWEPFPSTKDMDTMILQKPETTTITMPATVDTLKRLLLLQARTGIFQSDDERELHYTLGTRTDYGSDMRWSPYSQFDQETSDSPELMQSQIFYDLCLVLSFPTVFTEDLPLAKHTYWWHLRETERLQNGTYTAIPDSILGRIPESVKRREFPHMAGKTNNAGKVAFTENHAKGAKDVQTVMKPGKYLRRVLKDKVTDHKLKDLVAELNAATDFEVMTTTLPGVARNVYIDGPQSCMSHGKNRFGNTFDLDDNWRHPIEALFWPDGSGDIMLVYVENAGRPCARVLVNKESEKYPSIYVGDWAPSAKDVLNNWLESNGYTQSDDALEGATIPRIDLRNGKILCPYIDCQNLGVEIYNEHLMIGGDFKAAYEHGYVPEDDDRRTCDECGDATDDDDIHSVEDGQEAICTDCLNRNYVQAVVDYRQNINYRHERNVVDITPLTINSTEYVCEDVDLIDLGIVIDEEGEYTLTEDVIIHADDPDRHVQIHRCLQENERPNTCVPYVIIGDEANDAGDCAFLDDEGRWELIGDINEDEYIIVDRTAYLRDEEDVDAA